MYCPCGDFHQKIFSNLLRISFYELSKSTTIIILNYPKLCAVCCVMRDVWCTRIFCFKILTLWVKGWSKILHLGSFRPFEWYSKIDHRWQSYVHFQGLIEAPSSEMLSNILHHNLFHSWNVSKAWEIMKCIDQGPSNT